jgi:hypothetical protein
LDDSGSSGVYDRNSDLRKTKKDKLEERRGWLEELQRPERKRLLQAWLTPGTQEKSSGLLSVLPCPSRHGTVAFILRLLCQL